MTTLEKMAPPQLSRQVPMTDLIELAQRCEDASGQSQELDRLIARQFGWHRIEPRHAGNKHGAWISPEDWIGEMSDGSPKLDGLHGTTMHRDPPRLTSSLDAAESLCKRVLPGCRIYLTIRDGDANSAAAIDRAPFSHNYQQISAKAATPALALCAAILRAATKGKG